MRKMRKKQNAYAKKCEKKGKIKADDASHIFLGAKLLGKRRKERQMQQIIVFIMRKCEKKKQNAYAKQCGKCWQKHAEEASSLCDGAKWTTQEIHHACYCMFIIFYITGTACNSGRRSRCWVGGGLPPTIPCTQMTSVQLIGTLAFVRFSWSCTAKPLFL